jgi:hypothetical protein
LNSLYQYPIDISFLPLTQLKILVPLWFDGGDGFVRFYLQIYIFTCKIKKHELYSSKVKLSNNKMSKSQFFYFFVPELKLKEV